MGNSENPQPFPCIARQTWADQGRRRVQMDEAEDPHAAASMHPRRLGMDYAMV